MDHGKCSLRAAAGQNGVAAAIPILQLFRSKTDLRGGERLDRGDVQERAINGALRHVAVVMLGYIDSTANEESVFWVANLIEVAARKHDAKRLERPPVQGIA
jgi:hypothetical protein